MICSGGGQSQSAILKVVINNNNNKFNSKIVQAASSIQWHLLANEILI